MDEENKLADVSKQLDELLTDQKINLCSDLGKYLKRQPPQSEDAVKVGDLLLLRRELAGPASLDDVDYMCCCSLRYFSECCLRNKINKFHHKHSCLLCCLLLCCLMNHLDISHYHLNSHYC